MSTVDTEGGHVVDSVPRIPKRHMAMNTEGSHVADSVRIQSAIVAICV